MGHPLPGAEIHPPRYMPARNPEIPIAVMQTLQRGGANFHRSQELYMNKEASHRTVHHACADDYMYKFMLVCVFPGDEYYLTDAI